MRKMFLKFKNFIIHVFVYINNYALPGNNNTVRLHVNVVVIIMNTCDIMFSWYDIVLFI